LVFRWPLSFPQQGRHPVSKHSYSKFVKEVETFRCWRTSQRKAFRCARRWEADCVCGTGAATRAGTAIATRHNVLDSREGPGFIEQSRAF